MQPQTPPTCRVCTRSTSKLFGVVEGLKYWRCPRCTATFLDHRQLPSPDRERTHYLTHENDPSDPGYRAFLNRLAAPLLARLPPHSYGLDYGCGPGPALAKMLEEAGHTVALFDPFFAPNSAVLGATYDFVTCTETAEHFHDPFAEFRRFDALLKPGGRCAVMTLFQTDDRRFANWHYRKDPTHVVFYRERTMRCLADDLEWRVEFPHPNVAIFEKVPI
ncbi:MAG: class I SAM-dependent methyltransferase [Hyphomicrobiaceae bacterium]